MLSKSNRLRTMRDFRHLYKKARRLDLPSLTLRFVKNNLEVSRFAFIISNKTAKTAVARNRAKRQAREIIRKNLSQIKSGLDIAITIKHRFLSLPHEQQQEAIFSLLRKARLLKEE